MLEADFPMRAVTRLRRTAHRSVSDALTGGPARGDTAAMPLRALVLIAAAVALAVLGGGFFDGHF
jgi:hypothetical protein